MLKACETAYHLKHPPLVQGGPAREPINGEVLVEQFVGKSKQKFKAQYTLI